MSELIAIAYPEQERAKQVLEALSDLEHDDAAQFDKVVALSKDREGRYKMDGSRDSNTKRGAVAGGLVGTVVGMLVLAPVAGALFGAASGAVGGSIADVGRVDDFVFRVGDRMAPGSSLLVIHVEGGDPERILSALSQHGGKLIRTSLPADAETRIRAALGESAS